jgi:hypothetical protein
MRGKLIFGAGAAIGYLLGTRAGRERFDQITAKAKRFWENNTVQEAAGVVQTQAGRLYDNSKKMVSDQVHHMRDQRHERQEHQRHNKELRKKEFSDRNRKAAGWSPPTGVAATPQPNSVTTPY